MQFLYIQVSFLKKAKSSFVILILNDRFKGKKMSFLL